MTIADNPTAAASMTMKMRPTTRRRTPRAAASSGLIELIRSGRRISVTPASTTALSTSTSGTVDGATVKTEPKSIDCVEPVVVVCNVIK